LHGLALFGTESVLCDHFFIDLLNLVVIEAVPLLLSAIVDVGVVVAVLGITRVHKHRVKVVRVLVLFECDLGLLLFYDFQFFLETSEL